MMRFTVIGKDLMSDHLHALPEGTILEGYQILSVLGVGGFGITYLAQDTDELGKYFAIKEYLPNECAIRTENSTVLPKSSSDKEDYEWGLERFLDEAKTLATFDHPNLNTVFRFFHANGTAYMVLEYIKGETLSAKLKRDKTLDEASLVSLLKALTSGLDVVHKAGYVHRDIKPGNIMIKPDGTPILLDFGAARAAIGQRSKSITAILTPGYAPVEQYDITADDIGPWTDIYAMGMVAYKCITGCSDSELMDAVARSRLHRKNQIDQDLKPASEVGKNRYQADLLVSIDWAIKVNEEDRPQNVTVWVQSLLTGKNAERPSYQSTAPTSNQQTSQTRFKAGSATVATNNTSGTLKWLVMFVGVGVIAVAGYFISQYQSELAKGQSILYVNTQPQGAEIYLDSFYLGKTPYNKDDLPAGQFTLKLTHPDYIAKTDSITLANNEIISRRISDSGYPLQLKGGTLDLNVDANWNVNNDESAITVKLLVDQVMGDYAQNQFSDFNMALEFIGQDGWKLKQAASIEIGVVNVGVPLKDVSMRLDRMEYGVQEQPLIKLSDLSASVLEGSIYSEQVELDLNQRVNMFSIFLSSLSLEKLIALNQTEDLVASGTLDGELPMRLDNGVLLIDGGWLRADESGGYIKYSRIGEVLVGNKNLQLVGELLENFQYNEMSAKVDLLSGGELTLATKLHGRSPNAELNKQVNLNFNIDFNLWKFLESARLLTRIDQDISEQILSNQKR